MRYFYWFAIVMIGCSEKSAPPRTEKSAPPRTEESALPRTDAPKSGSHLSGNSVVRFRRLGKVFVLTDAAAARIRYIVSNSPEPGEASVRKKIPPGMDPIRVDPLGTFEIDGKSYEWHGYELVDSGTSRFWANIFLVEMTNKLMNHLKTGNSGATAPDEIRDILRELETP